MLSQRVKLSPTVEMPSFLIMNMITMFRKQKDYSKIRAYHLKSTKAKIESSVLLPYVTSARLGDGKWKDTTESFIN